MLIRVFYVFLLTVAVHSHANSNEHTVREILSDEVYTYDEHGNENGALNAEQLSNFREQLPLKLESGQFDSDTGFFKVTILSQPVILHDAEVMVTTYRPVECGPVASIDRNLDGMGANSACED